MKPLPVSPADTVAFSRIVRGLKFFGSIDMVTLERVLGGLQRFACARGEKVCTQGSPGDFFFVVQRGRLAVSRRKGGFSLARKVAELGPGDCFGEMALLDDAPRNATVACLADCELFVLPAPHFRGVLEHNPEFAQEIRALAAARQAEPEP